LLALVCGVVPGTGVLDYQQAFRIPKWHNAVLASL
jgi:hypothetical protein